MALGWQIYQTLRRLRRRLFTWLLRGSFRRFGQGSTLEPPARLLGLRQISLGADVFIGPNSWLTFLGDLKPGSKEQGIFVGSRVAIAGDCVLSAAQLITIGDDVQMGRHVHISDHAHRADDPSLPIGQQGITTPAPVRIGAGAWLGQGVVICPGVTIGQRAVIGANSVVRIDVPDHSLAAGAPATIKRQLRAP